MSADATHRTVFAQNVRAAREAKGLTQEKLAWASGLHQTEVARIEKGTRNPGLDTIVKIAQGLGVTPSVLLKGVG